MTDSVLEDFLTGLKDKDSVEEFTKATHVEEPVEVAPKLPAIELTDHTFSSVTGITPDMLKSEKLYDFNIKKVSHENFSEEVQEFIKTKDEFFKEHVNFTPNIKEAWLFVRAMEQGDNVYLYGGASTGKTTFPAWYAAVTGRPFIRLTGGMSVNYASLFGTATFEGDEVTYSYGILAEAFRGGAVFLFDEPTASPPDICFGIQEMLENGNFLRINNIRDSKTEKILNRHDEFQFVAADNTGGMGDDQGLYAGTHVWNRATLSRFHTYINVTSIPDDVLKSVIESRVPECAGRVVDRIVAFSRKTTKLREKGDLSFDMALREMFSAAEQYTRVLDFTTAVETSFINKLPQDERASAVAIIGLI